MAKTPIPASQEALSPQEPGSSQEENPSQEENSSQEANPSQLIDSYIQAFPPKVAELLRSLRAAIREAAPEAQEKISYKMPTFWLGQNLVHFAGYAKHIGFYPGPSGIEEFQAELAGFKNSKGAVQFSLNQSLPLELIKRIVRFRVRENLAAQGAKKAESGKAKA